MDRGVAVAGAALAELGEASLLGLDPAAVAESLVALSALAAEVAELEHRVVAHAVDVRVEEPSGATTTATWLAHATRATRRAARRAVHLAEALRRFAVLRGAMAAGRVNLEQDTVVARALEELPDDVPSWVVAEAERTLVELAAPHDADDLRVLGDRVLVVVAPEVGEAHEAAQLAAAEKDAERATKLTLTPDGSGRVHGRFIVPELHAAMLRKMLMALVVPDGAVLGGGPQRRTTAVELGRAFCELLERLDGREAPKVGGTGATVVVTMSLETLQGGLASTVLETGDRIAAHTARRLACEAGILPVVLGGKGQVLDQGRAQRFAHVGAGDRAGCAGRWVRSGRLPYGGLVRRRAPRRPLVDRRPYRSGAGPTAVSQPPQAGPRPGVRASVHGGQTRRLHPADVSRAGRVAHRGPLVETGPGGAESHP